MDNIAENLPRNKFDFERVIPLLSMLLEWVQDMNWAIASEIVEILVAFPNEIIPHIRNVFSTDDDIWKFWCLECLVKRLPARSKELLKNDLIRMTTKPSEDEKIEEVNLKAKEILDSI